MTFLHGSQARFYYHRVDMSGFVEAATLDQSTAVAEYRPLNATDVRRALGHDDSRIALAGGALATVNQELAWNEFRQNPGRPWAFLIAGDALGRLAQCGVALGENQQRVAGDDIVRLPLAMVGSGPLDVGVVLRALAAGGTSPGGSVDNAVATANGGAAYLICTAISGTTPLLTAIVQHSVDGVTAWDTLLTMTGLGVAGSEVRTVAGAVRRHVRVSWTLTGGGAAATWFLAFCRR